MIIISNLVLEIYDSNTIASTDIYGADKKTYVNIGSGNVFQLDWDLGRLQNDTLDHFNVVIKRYDPVLNVYYDILHKNVGAVFSFSVKADYLPAAPAQYMLSIYVVAYGKKGSVITSNVVNTYVCKGSGSYVKVEYDDYKQPIMKRALAFAKTASSMSAAMASLTEVLTDIDGYVLLDSDDKVLSVMSLTQPTETQPTELVSLDGLVLKFKDEDETEKVLLAPATKLLTSVTGWEVMQEGYTKGTDGEWHTNDIRFEVLIAGGESNDYGTIIEVIVSKDGDDADGNPINPVFEPLYVL